MSLVTLAIVSTLAAAVFSLVLDPARRRLRVMLRAGLASALLAAGALELAPMGPAALELVGRDLVAFVVASPFAAACAQLINGAFLLSRRTAPLTGWIMAIEAVWGVPGLVVWSSPKHPQDVAFDLCLASWTIYISEALPAARRWVQIVGGSLKRLGGAVGDDTGAQQR